MSSINSIIKNDTTYEIHDARVDNMTGVFEATYGVTTFAEILEKYNDGWTIICNYNNGQYEMVYHTDDSFKFAVTKADSSLTIFQYECISISPSTGWTIDVEQLQRKLVAGDNITISGNTISAEGGSGSTVSYSETQTQGTEIGKLTIDGTTTTLYAPEGGSGSVEVDGTTIIKNDEGKIETALGGYAETIHHDAETLTQDGWSYSGSDFYYNADETVVEKWFQALKSMIGKTPKFTVSFHPSDGTNYTKDFTFTEALTSSLFTENTFNESNTVHCQTDSGDYGFYFKVIYMNSVRRLHIWWDTPAGEVTGVNSVSFTYDAYDETNYYPVKDYRLLKEEVALEVGKSIDSETSEKIFNNPFNFCFKIVNGQETYLTSIYRINKGEGSAEASLDIQTQLSGITSTREAYKTSYWITFYNLVNYEFVSGSSYAVCGCGNETVPTNLIGDSGYDFAAMPDIRDADSLVVGAKFGNNGYLKNYADMIFRGGYSSVQRKVSAGAGALVAYIGSTSGTSQWSSSSVYEYFPMSGEEGNVSISYGDLNVLSEYDSDGIYYVKFKLSNSDGSQYLTIDGNRDTFTWTASDDLPIYNNVWVSVNSEISTVIKDNALPAEYIPVDVQRKLNSVANDVDAYCDECNQLHTIYGGLRQTIAIEGIELSGLTYDNENGYYYKSASDDENVQKLYDAFNLFSYYASFSLMVNYDDSVEGTITDAFNIHGLVGTVDGLNADLSVESVSMRQADCKIAVGFLTKSESGELDKFVLKLVNMPTLTSLTSVRMDEGEYENINGVINPYYMPIDNDTIKLNTFTNKIYADVLPAHPTTAGTYNLQCVIDSEGNATYSWVAQG